jgi:hypothetical protein
MVPFCFCLRGCYFFSFPFRSFNSYVYACFLPLGLGAVSSLPFPYSASNCH